MVTITFVSNIFHYNYLINMTYYTIHHVYLRIHLPYIRIKVILVFFFLSSISFKHQVWQLSDHMCRLRKNYDSNDVAHPICWCSFPDSKEKTKKQKILTLSLSTTAPQGCVLLPLHLHGPVSEDPRGCK